MAHSRRKSRRKDSQSNNDKWMRGLNSPHCISFLNKNFDIWAWKFFFVFGKYVEKILTHYVFIHELQRRARVTVLSSLSLYYKLTLRPVPSSTDRHDWYQYSLGIGNIPKMLNSNPCISIHEYTIQLLCRSSYNVFWICVQNQERGIEITVPLSLISSNLIPSIKGVNAAAEGRTGSFYIPLAAMFWVSVCSPDTRGLNQLQLEHLHKALLPG